jgi:hypothetical protein
MDLGGGAVARTHVEPLLALVAHLVVVVVRHGGTERPEGTAPAVVGARLVQPQALHAHPVAERAVVALCLHEELHRDVPEVPGCIRTALVTRGDHEQPCVVVRAVAVRIAGLGALRVLEDAAVVREGDEVPHGHRA